MIHQNVEIPFNIFQSTDPSNAVSMPYFRNDNIVTNVLTMRSTIPIALRRYVYEEKFLFLNISDFESLTIQNISRAIDQPTFLCAITDFNQRPLVRLL